MTWLEMIAPQDRGLWAIDWSLLQIASDLAEESSCPVATLGLRWMVKNQKRPYHERGDTWIWFDQRRTSLQADPWSDLPDKLYDLLLNYEEEKPCEKSSQKVYPDLESCLKDLFRALRKAGEI